MPDPVNPNNRYDERDIVRRGTVLYANGLKFAAYKVRDPALKSDDAGAFSKRQFHLTWDNTLLAILDEDCLPDLEVVANRSTLKDLGEGEVMDCLKPSGRYIVYRDGGDISIQVRRGEMILGKFGLETAKLLLTLAKNEFLPAESAA